MSLPPPRFAGAIRPRQIPLVVALSILILAFAAALLPATARAATPESAPAPRQQEPAAPLPDDAAQAAGNEIDAIAPEAGPVKSYLPIIFYEYSSISPSRIGFGSGWRPIASYQDIRELNAGWYTNWGVSVNPSRPLGIQYVQMVRVHQKLTCEHFTTADRVQCPYASPPAYDRSPDDATIIAAARANPGSTWVIGNEIDRVDFEGGGQDEILPEVYALAYHSTYNLIKSADPTAKVAIGGIIQFTPLREQYLNRIWDAYRAKYHTNMPVDVWNMHNFIGPEVCQMEPRNGVPTRICYGMAIPPGFSGTWETLKNGLKVEHAAYFGENWRVIHRETFAAQIRGMRKWMKDHGQDNKPLIITEYGVLWGSLCPASEHPTQKARDACIAGFGQNYVNLEDPAVIHDFMLWTFDFFRTERDCSLTTYDDCRLVQQWAWYGLEDASWGFNPHAFLLNPANNRLSMAGQAYAAYVKRNLGTLTLPNNRLP